VVYLNDIAHIPHSSKQKVIVSPLAILYTIAAEAFQRISNRNYSQKDIISEAQEWVLDREKGKKIIGNEEVEYWPTTVEPSEPMLEDELELEGGRVLEL